jgi:hypothetical protein
MEGITTTEACIQHVQEGFELVETAKLQKLIDVNKQLGTQNVELKQDLVTVISSFAGLQATLGLENGNLSLSVLTKLTTSKGQEKMKKYLAPMLEVVGKYIAVAGE